MSNFLIQYTVEASDLSDATAMAHGILYKSDIDAKNVKVVAADHPSVVTFDEPVEALEAREVSSDLFQQHNKEYKDDHPWGV